LLGLRRGMKFLDVGIGIGSRLGHEADGDEYGEESNQDTADGWQDDLFVVHSSYSPDKEFQGNSRNY